MCTIKHFYPRSPCGERPTALRTPHHKNTISIHALLAESDITRYFFNAVQIISIHALLAESDDDLEPSNTRRLTFLSTLSLRRATQSRCFRRFLFAHFYPRSPCGERRAELRVVWGYNTISIHALLAESDSKSAQNSGALLRI